MVLALVWPSVLDTDDRPEGLGSVEAVKEGVERAAGLISMGIVNLVLVVVSRKMTHCKSLAW